MDVIADIVDAGETDEYLLAPVALSSRGGTPAQARLALDYGFYVIGIALNYPVHHGHSTLLRLYRAGYQLVEVGAWTLPGKAPWRPARDLEDQEKAVDRLLEAPSIAGPRLEFTYGKGAPSRAEKWNAQSLRPGSAAPGHREALLFAASEYERLATLLGPDQDGPAMRDRLLRKARQLRDRTAE